MKNSPIPSASQRRPLLSPTRGAVIAYVLTAGALWLWYPRVPHLIIDAGPAAQFAGFMPDGRSVVTVQLGRVQFWNVRSGRPGPSINMDGKFWGQPVDFSTDGKRLSIGIAQLSTNGRVSVGRNFYSAESGKKLSSVRLPGFLDSDQAVVSESPDGLTIASSGRDVTIVNNVVTGDLRFRVSGGTAAAFDANSKTLAVAAKTNPGRWAVKFFDPITGNEQSIFAEGDGIVNGIAFSPKGNKLALVVWQDAYGPSETRGIQLWDIASEKREEIFPMERDDVANLGRLQFLADGHVISTAGLFRGFAWDLTVQAPDNLVGKVGLTPFPTILSSDGRLAAILDIQARLINVRRLGNAKVEVVCRRAYTHDAYPIAITPDGQLIFSVQPPGHGLRRIISTVFPIWAARYDVIDIASGRLLGHVPQVDGSGPAGVSPDGRTLVTSEFPPKGTPGRFTLWNVPAATPWPAILGSSVIPAIAVGWLLRERQRSPRKEA